MSSTTYGSYERGQVTRQAPTMKWDPSWPNHPRDPTSIPISQNSTNSYSSKKVKALRSRPRAIRRQDEQPTNSERQQRASGRVTVSHLALNDDDEEDDGLMSASSSDEHNLESPAAQVAMMQNFFR